MLGQPVSMLIPEVVGFKLHGKLPAGRDRDRSRAHRHRRCCARRKSSESSSSSTARASRVLSLADRATIAQHGARVRRDDGLLPGRRGDAQVSALYRARRGAGAARRGVLQGAGTLPHRRHARSGVHATPSSSISATVEPSLAGPKRPQDRVPLKMSKQMFSEALDRGSRANSARVAAVAARKAGDRASPASPQLSASRRGDRSGRAGGERLGGASRDERTEVRAAARRRS